MTKPEADDLWAVMAMATLQLRPTVPLAEACRCAARAPAARIGRWPPFQLHPPPHRPTIHLVHILCV